MAGTGNPGEGRAEDAAAPEPDERARARAYLDLWERQVVQLALIGPAAAARRPPVR
jgi:hypothetical protein